MGNEWKREMARLEGFDIRDDDHGGLCMGGSFKFDAGGQGFGYRIDIEFVQKLMAVFGVDRLQDVNGKHAWVTHLYSDIRLVEPVLPEEGESFDIHAWAGKPRKARTSK